MSPNARSSDEADGPPRGRCCSSLFTHMSQKTIVCRLSTLFVVIFLLLGLHGCSEDDDKPQDFENSDTPPTAPTAPPVLGAPGKSWTEDEALVVKAKLWQIFTWTTQPAHDILYQLYGSYAKDGPYAEIVGGTGRFATSAVRLGFHGCIRDSGGTGGCDGCLFSDRLNHIYMDYHGQNIIPDDFPEEHLAPNFHNGLKPIVDVLEEVYTNESFPEKSPFLNVSLFQSGKSRADLWALAASVAIEFSIGQNNMVCNNPDWDWPVSFPDSLETNGFWSRHCTQKQGLPDCAINVVNHIKFRTGRQDCVPTQMYQLMQSSTCPKHLDILKEWQCQAAGTEQGVFVQFDTSVPHCSSIASGTVASGMALCHMSATQKYNSGEVYYVVNPLFTQQPLETCLPDLTIKDESDCIKASEFLLLPFVRQDNYQEPLEYSGCFVFTEYLYGGRLRYVVEYQEGLPPPPKEWNNRLRSICHFPDQKVMGYMAARWGNAPGSQMDSDMTVKFFEEEFGLNPRETVALLGAHTLGRFHARSSLFRYVWVRSGGQLLNNEYYRNMANLPAYRFTDPACGRLGDANGNPPVGQWRISSRTEQKNGGPFAWHIYRRTCTVDCNSDSGGSYSRNAENEDMCCTDIPEGGTCNPSCEDWTSEGGNHEMMLPSEMGLFYKFHVNNTDTFPAFSGCPGMANLANPDCYWFSGAQCQPSEPGCPLNDAPAGNNMKMHEVVELYATNQDLWVKEFNEVFEKVLHNGYDVSQMTEGPDATTDVVCPYQTNHLDPNLKYWVCISTKHWSQPFLIRSARDGHLLQLHEITGVFETSPPDSAATAYPTNQLWYWAPLPGGGEQLVNGISYFGVGNLYYNSTSSYLQNHIGMLSRGYTGEAVTYYPYFDDTPWNQDLYKWSIENIV